MTKYKVHVYSYTYIYLIQPSKQVYCFVNGIINICYICVLYGVYKTIFLIHCHQSKKRITSLRLLCISLLLPIQNTWVSKIPHFIYLLLTLVILLLPESLLVIYFIYWHTEYLPFTTNNLIWRFCFHVPKYLHWDDPELFVMEYFQRPELVIIYIHYIYNQYTVTCKIALLLYIFLLFYIFIGDCVTIKANHF